MKKTVFLLSAVLLIFSACLSKPEKKDTPAAQTVDVEKLLSGYDLTVLSKIEHNELPKFVIAIISDSTVIEEADIDLAGFLQTEINNTGRVTLVDRNQMDKIMEEQKLQLSGMTDSVTAEVGEILGADYILTAQVVSASDQKIDKVAYDALEIEIVLQINLVNVSTGELYKSFKAGGKTSEKIITDADGNLITGAVDYANLYAAASQNALQSVIPEFINSFPAVGFVLRVDGNVFTTDLGNNVLARPGQMVAFISQGAPVTHPLTGEILNYEYEYYAFGSISEIQARTSVITINDENLPPGDAIAVLID